jgi:hypothetical protein
MFSGACSTVCLLRVYKILFDLGYTTGEFGKNHLGDHTAALYYNMSRADGWKPPKPRLGNSSIICRAPLLLRKNPVVAGSGTGMGRALSSIVGKVIGADAGIMVAAVTQIEQTGLTLEQIKNIGDGLLSYIKDVDPALAKEISDTVPGLRDHVA